MTAIPQSRTRRTALVSAVCALVLTGTGLTGCSEDPDEGTNGVGKLPVAEIQRKTRSAADSARAVHLSGNLVSSGHTYQLDMRVKTDGATGSVTAQGTTFQLLRIGEELYLKADTGFWSEAGHDGKADAAAVDKLEGKYVRVPQRDPVYRKFSGFTDKDALLDNVLALHGEAATDGHHEQNGVRTIRVTGDEGAGGTLDISLEGSPYPLLLTRAGGGGTLTFSDWGKDFALKKPKKGETVDYGKQLPTS